MGVWRSGPDPTIVDIPGIAKAMRPALEAWMTGHIQIVDMKRSLTTQANAETNELGTSAPTVVLDSGENGALIQPMRAPSRVEVGAQASGILGVRFQVKSSATITPGTKLRGGLAVRVLDGGNASLLEGKLYSLSEVEDSSLMWDYIFEAVVVTGSA